MPGNKKKCGKWRDNKYPSWSKILIAILFLGFIGSVIGQEGQIIKEIKIINKVQDTDVLYKFPEPILLY